MLGRLCVSLFCFYYSSLILFIMEHVSNGDSAAYIAALMATNQNANRTTEVLNASDRNLIVFQNSQQLQALQASNNAQFAALQSQIQANALNAKIDNLATGLANCCCENRVANATIIQKLNDMK